MPAVFLADRSFLRLTGPDCRNFLNNLVTADLESIAQGCASVAALLTPQGKILFEFLVYPQLDDIVLEVSTEDSQALQRRLTMYKLRAAVTITVEETPGVTVFWNSEAPEGSFQDMRFKVAGQDVWRKPGHHGTDASSAYDDLRISHGIAEAGRDYALQDAFPHDVLLDLNSGVSFKKGCYVGQEVVSRMHHRKTARRRVVIVSAETPLPQSGTELRADDRPLGRLGTVSGNRGLAIVRIDRVGEALQKGSTIVADTVAVSAQLPAWTGIEFPTTAEDS